MEDLLRYQIKCNCKIAVPEGLKELMSDISREVLRAQPNDLYGFITSYLSSLLVTRENLTIASRICDNVCENTCYPELEDELRFIGLDDERVEVAAKIIRKYFDKDQVKEGNLLMTLMRKIKLSEAQLEEVQIVVRNAYRRHQMNHTVIYQSSSDSDIDDAASAAQHTLKLYRKSKPSEWRYNYMKDQVNASYQAYENIGKNPSNEKQPETASEVPEAENKLESDKTICEVQPRSPLKHKLTTSMTSLAGSSVELGKYKPYTSNNLVMEDVQEECDDESEQRVPQVFYNSNEIDIKNEGKVSFRSETSGSEQFKEVDNNTGDESEKSVQNSVSSYEIFKEKLTSDAIKFTSEDGYDYNDCDDGYDNGDEDDDYVKVKLLTNGDTIFNENVKVKASKICNVTVGNKNASTVTGGYIKSNYKPKGNINTDVSKSNKLTDGVAKIKLIPQGNKNHLTVTNSIKVTVEYAKVNLTSTESNILDDDAKPSKNAIDDVVTSAAVNIDSSNHENANPPRKRNKTVNDIKVKWLPNGSKISEQNLNAELLSISVVGNDAAKEEKHIESNYNSKTGLIRKNSNVSDDVKVMLKPTGIMISDDKKNEQTSNWSGIIDNVKLSSNLSENSHDIQIKESRIFDDVKVKLSPYKGNKFSGDVRMST